MNCKYTYVLVLQIGVQMVEMTVDDDELVSLAILRAVSIFENVRQESLPPLYSVVDPDALNALVSNPDTESVFKGTVSFQYYGLTVVVSCQSPVMVTVSK